MCIHHGSRFYRCGLPLFLDTFTTYMIRSGKYCGMHANVASGIMTAALFVFMLIQPLIGALSDKIGRRTAMLCFGSLAAIFTVPILSALQNVSSPYAAFGLVMCALLIVSFYTSISGILKAEMFPAQVRALGVGLSYAVANAIFGGSAEYVALSLKSIEMETAFFWYVTLMAVVAFLVSLMLHRKGRGCALVTGQLPDGIAVLTGDIPGQILPAPAASLRGGYPKALLMPPNRQSNINPNMALLIPAHPLML